MLLFAPYSCFLSLFFFSLYSLPLNLDFPFPLAFSFTISPFFSSSSYFLFPPLNPPSGGRASCYFPVDTYLHHINIHAVVFKALGLQAVAVILLNITVGTLC
jgi:hypothetical protein